MQGYKGTEIADILNITESNVSMMTSKYYKKLGEIYEQEKSGKIIGWLVLTLFLAVTLLFLVVQKLHEDIISMQVFTGLDCIPIKFHHNNMIDLRCRKNMKITINKEKL